MKNRIPVAAGLVTIGVAILLGAYATRSTEADREPLSEAAPAVTVTVTKAGPKTTVTATPKVAKSTSKPSPLIEEGVWVVGEDIPAGVYRAKEAVEEGCSWAIYRSGTNQSDIVAIDLPGGGRPRVTLKKGHDFASRSCGDWEKVG